MIIYYSDNCIEYESNGGGNKTSVEEYVNLIRPYLKDINIPIKSDTWTI